MGNGPTDCVGRACDYAIAGDAANCQTGQGACSIAHLLEAEPSGFHDQKLIAVTKQINAILAGIPADSEGRKLSFLHTNNGSLLAWVNHSATAVSKDAVTAKDDDATIAKALKLKGYARAGAS